MASTTVVVSQVPLSELRFSGSGLKRPECVLATASGGVVLYMRWIGVQGLLALYPTAVR